ncbi:MAG: LysR family transcriptional regulator, partial [Syntrophaceticus sp.]|nr:LysR family transcriptional regulator [Syntrophaceticus sp.]
YGSFTKAAEHLFTTQSNVSKHIKRLETYLGAPLFIRDGKNIQLTNMGNLFILEAKDIVTRLEKFREGISKSSIGEFGYLRLGYQSDINLEDIASITSTFSSTYPNVEIIFTKKAIESDLLSAVYNGELDLSLTSATVGLDLEGICYREIAPNELVLVVPSEHRFRNFDIVHKADLVGEQIILFPRHLAPTYFDWIVKSILGNNQHTIILESDLRNILLQVGSGKAISILATLYLKSKPKNVHIVKLEYVRNEININLILSWIKTNNNPLLPLLLQSL